jgi:hypothetical protein
MSRGRGNVLHFDNHLEGFNLFNKKFAEGELLGQQPPENLGLVQLGAHFEGNICSRSYDMSQSTSTSGSEQIDEGDIEQGGWGTPMLTGGFDLIATKVHEEGIRPAAPCIGGSSTMTCTWGAGPRMIRSGP